jgi:hypothetical protein
LGLFVSLRNDTDPGEVRDRRVRTLIDSIEGLTVPLLAAPTVTSIGWLSKLSRRIIPLGGQHELQGCCS